jgi:hypothetical protein
MSTLHAIDCASEVALYTGQDRMESRREHCCAGGNRPKRTRRNESSGQGPRHPSTNNTQSKPSPCICTVNTRVLPRITAAKCLQAVPHIRKLHCSIALTNTEAVNIASLDGPLGD